MPINKLKIYLFMRFSSCVQFSQNDYLISCQVLVKFFDLNLKTYHSLDSWISFLQYKMLELILKITIYFS